MLCRGSVEQWRWRQHAVGAAATTRLFGLVGTMNLWQIPAVDFRKNPIISIPLPSTTTFVP